MNVRRLEDRVGRTPLIELMVVIGGRLRRLFLKLECKNPTGSIKDRTAVALVKNLTETHTITANTVVIESTSGNLGVALAAISQFLGFRFIAVMDPKAIPFHVSRIRSFGGHVDFVTEPDLDGNYLTSRLARVRARVRGREGVMLHPDQYQNPVCAEVHHTTTGPEIGRQVPCQVDAVFVAVSTGGTLAGISQYFREAFPQTQIVAVDVMGSRALGGSSGPRHLTGIGASVPATLVSATTYDVCERVADAEAFAMCRLASEKLGLSIGGSGGAVLFACFRQMAAHPELESAVCVMPDSGAAYRETVYDDSWLRERGHAKESIAMLVDEFMTVRR
ncbi:pyridoxal-phosphate dependent enzyme [Streptomyces mirabilis]|uniref:pyridoxal-phosphate dependent enzyme n=1 Tax=Streptomyces mirabilis TaxID=68239 RepID=UPI00371FD41A